MAVDVLLAVSSRLMPLPACWCVLRGWLSTSLALGLVCARATVPSAQPTAVVHAKLTRDGLRFLFCLVFCLGLVAARRALKCGLHVRT